MVKSIRPIAPSVLVPAEVVTTGERVNEIIAPAIQSDAFVTPELAALNASLTSLKADIQSNSIGPYTAALAAKDAARVSEFRGLVSMLQGISGVKTKPDNKSAADFLLALVGRQGNRISNLSYTRKTGMFASILESLNDPDAQAYVKQLGLADMVAALSAAQDDFEALHQTKMKANGRQPGISTRSLAADVCYHVMNLVQYVDAQAQRDPVFQSLVPLINSTVADIMSKAHARKTRSLDANASPVPTPAPAPAVTTTNAPAKAIAEKPVAEAVAASPSPGGNGSSPKTEVLAQAA